MSHKLRSVNTRFWDDGFVVDLTPTEKLLFLYLITNPLTKLIGIYEISLKRISFDTGLNQQQIEKGFERFGKVRKVFFVDGWIILPNWLKNQKLNSNMKIAVEKEFKELPNDLIDKLINNENGTVSNGYESISNALAMYRQEEVEREPKYKENGNFIPPSLDMVIEYCKNERKNDVDANRWINFYTAKNWMIGKNKMKDWKAAVRTWEEDKQSKQLKILQK